MFRVDGTRTQVYELKSDPWFEYSKQLSALFSGQESLHLVSFGVKRCDGYL